MLQVLQLAPELETMSSAAQTQQAGLRLTLYSTLYRAAKINLMVAVRIQCWQLQRGQQG